MKALLLSVMGFIAVISPAYANKQVDRNLVAINSIRGWYDAPFANTCDPVALDLAFSKANDDLKVADARLAALATINQPELMRTTIDDAVSHRRSMVEKKGKLIGLEWYCNNR